MGRCATGAHRGGHIGRVVRKVSARLVRPVAGVAVPWGNNNAEY